MGWALDGGEDIGGQMADRDLWIEEMERIAGIKDDRKLRVKLLSGKYVVATTGKSSGKTVFFQDRKINKGGYWTQYLSNALGFKDLNSAIQIAKGFKYGNPRVAIVTSEGIYQWIN
ncbi:hypothetical protein BK704_20765 [[Bacillus thuringiensis] serovar konkukian]|nr:hypothetical protein [Bacillus thuringiensis]MED1301735.1 hypothetical protein [Bacillus pacificus]OUB02662.1 hypothetical protein BK704_20765 [[Bacillus thuringiensis] serovar konkukian]